MKKILIVDDEQSLRSALGELLSDEADYTVFQAEHGMEALQVLKEHQIDLMLLDVDMPFLNGVGVVKAIQTQAGEYAQPEILVLTNRGDMDMVSEMVELKMFDYLIKSDHSLDEIIQMVRVKLA
jgi:DNA-binding response OmpR family regulator